MQFGRFPNIYYGADFPLFNIPSTMHIDNAVDAAASMATLYQQDKIRVAEERFYGEVAQLIMDNEQAACDRLLEEGGKVNMRDQEKVTAWQEKMRPELYSIWYDTIASESYSEAEEFYTTFMADLDQAAGSSGYERGVDACAERSGA